MGVVLASLSLAVEAQFLGTILAQGRLLRLCAFTRFASCCHQWSQYVRNDCCDVIILDDFLMPVAIVAECSGAAVAAALPTHAGVSQPIGNATCRMSTSA